MFEKIPVEILFFGWERLGADALPWEERSYMPMYLKQEVYESWVNILRG